MEGLWGQDATKRAFGDARIRELRRTEAAALGSEAAADAWLEQPEPAMGGMTPRTVLSCPFYGVPPSWSAASCGQSLPPHQPSDVFFLRANGVGVNGGRAEVGVAEPLLHQVERNTGGDGGHPETVPQGVGALGGRRTR